MHHKPFSAYLWVETEDAAQQKQCRQQEVFSLPMRNWNININENIMSLLRFSAYLWGIETIPGLSPEELDVRGFQPTYEELKQHCEKQLALGSSNVFSLPMRNWNQVFWIEAFRRYVVFSLPMRNWNTVPAIDPGTHENWFSAYLWGIETPFPFKLLRKFYGFSAYLWGIETRTTDIITTGLLLVFSLPMRNWNFNFFNSLI